MLRCEGCSVLHHPGCWVTNGGCATQAEHRVAPQAQAYTSGSRSPGAQAPHPGEGTRVPSPPGPGAAEPLGPIPFRQPPRAANLPGEEPVIGVTPPSAHTASPVGEIVPPTPPRRYVPPSGEQVPRKPLPRIYERHRILGFWYIPVAVALAVAVAFSVVWGAGRLFDGDSAPSAPAATPTTAAATTAPAQTPSPAATSSTTPQAGSPVPSATASTGPGKFTAGQVLVVTGTGDCLNVRTNPGVQNDAIVCIADATEVKVTGGPQQEGGLIWWKIETRLGEGWAAEEYLVKKP